MLDNFQLVKERLLDFSSPNDFYFVFILRRRKDIKGSVPEGVNEDNRMLKHYFVSQAEYLDKKKQAIVQLCEQNDARAYILPQRRDSRLVLWAIHDKASDLLKSGAANVHFDHLIRSCVAGMHEVPPDKKDHKRWVIDIDKDEMLSHVLGWGSITGNTGWQEGEEVRYYVDFLVQKIGAALMLYIGGDVPKDAREFMPKGGHRYVFNPLTVVPTPHGWHIVTPPFNRDIKAMDRYFGTPIPAQCIKPDAATLLYAPDAIA